MSKEVKNEQPIRRSKSFYIASVICGIAVIAAGVVIVSSISGRTDIAQQEIIIPTPMPQENIAKVESASKSKTDVPKETPKVTKPQQPVTEEVTSDPLPKQELASTKLIMPVKGVVTVNHSMDTLVYSPTFEDWRIHKGIDIDAEMSEQVKSVADGVVEAAYTDEMLGNVIEINHGDFISVYCGVSTIEMVKAGQELKQGDIISGIGNTSLNESRQNPHLHFEILYGGNCVDPIQYLKEQ